MDVSLRAGLPSRLAPGLALAALLVLAAHAPAPAFSSPPRAAAPIVSGDLIVKFRDTRPAGMRKNYVLMQLPACG